MKQETLRINIHKRRLAINVNGVEFKEGNSFIIYLPSLNISAYGDTLAEAKEMLEVCLNEFSKDIFLNFKKDSAIKAYLRELGWEKVKYSNKKMIKLSETTYDDIIKEFDLPKSTVVESFEEKYSVTV